MSAHGRELPRFGSSRCLDKGTSKPHPPMIPGSCAWEQCYPSMTEKRAFILPRNNNRRISVWLEHHPTRTVIPRLFLGTSACLLVGVSKELNGRDLRVGSSL
ncbi:hypothetical protein FA13DRAFT_1729374 [Coprinellus micaceus]|uniref:Uncharacterized protein n=1 Tax=Coprinellus micaceus TaxID=71717 RepID=A0A4Y7TME8_COPMI|nr:hypothetical protein FA13DRAFT_1729374 [Coprinellus micaceus]